MKERRVNNVMKREREEAVGVFFPHLHALCDKKITLEAQALDSVFKKEEQRKHMNKIDLLQPALPF